MSRCLFDRHDVGPKEVLFSKLNEFQYAPDTTKVLVHVGLTL